MARTRKDTERNRRSAAIRGLERKAHFEAGGTLEAWRGRHLVETDRRKEGSRRACRGRARDAD